MARYSGAPTATLAAGAPTETPAVTDEALGEDDAQRPVTTCQYDSGARPCRTKVNAGVPYCSNHRCPTLACGGAKSSKAATCETCLYANADDEYGPMNESDDGSDVDL